MDSHNNRGVVDFCIAPLAEKQLIVNHQVSLANANTIKVMMLHNSAQSNAGFREGTLVLKSWSPNSWWWKLVVDVDCYRSKAHVSSRMPVLIFPTWQGATGVQLIGDSQLTIEVTIPSSANHIMTLAPFFLPI